MHSQSSRRNGQNSGYNNDNTARENRNNNRQLNNKARNKNRTWASVASMRAEPTHLIDSVDIIDYLSPSTGQPCFANRKHPDYRTGRNAPDWMDDHEAALYEGRTLAAVEENRRNGEGVYPSDYDDDYDGSDGEVDMTECGGRESGEGRELSREVTEEDVKFMVLASGRWSRDGTEPLEDKKAVRARQMGEAARREKRRVEDVRREWTDARW